MIPNVFGLLGNNIYRESPSVSTSVSLEAQKALIKIGKPAVKPLINALNNDDYNIRQVSSLILLKMGELAVKPLISLLNYDNEHNSELAEMILINMLEISEPYLISALSNPAPLLRSQTAKILGKNSVKKPYLYFYYDFVSAGFFYEKHGLKRNVSTIIKSLIDSLNDENKIVRISAQNSLKLITKENFGMDYIKWRKWFDQNIKQFSI